MGKEKDSPSVDGEFDLFDDDEVPDMDVDQLEEDASADMIRSVGSPAPAGTTARRSGNPETRRRLNAYMERQWFRDLGWDDDDELFNDEFFSEPPGHLHHSA